MSRLRANQITNQSADGAPTVQNGLIVTGVTTSTTFSGSGASLTNIPSAQLTGALPALDGSELTGISGFATALSSDQSSLLNQIFKTNREASISETILIQSDAASGNMAFTRLNRINVVGSGVLHIGAGTTFKMNVLDLF